MNRELYKNNIKLIIKQTENVLKEVLTLSQIEKGLVVIGCSTSAINGEKIGSNGSHQLAEDIFNVLNTSPDLIKFNLAFQCCEHLNRAIVMERRIAEKFNYEEVKVLPKIYAGGALATIAYKYCSNPIIVEFIKADIGIDIGGVMVGMHIKHVAVPLKLKNNFIGGALVIAAKYRPKLIGGERASYGNQI